MQSKVATGISCTFASWRYLPALAQLQQAPEAGPLTQDDLHFGTLPAHAYSLFTTIPKQALLLTRVAQGVSCYAAAMLGKHDSKAARFCIYWLAHMLSCMSCML